MRLGGEQLRALVGRRLRPEVDALDVLRMSAPSAAQPSAARRPGSAPAPPLWPGTWKRVEPRVAYATTASMYGALGCSGERVPGGSQRAVRSSSEMAT